MAKPLFVRNLAPQAQQALKGNGGGAESGGHQGQQGNTGQTGMSASSSYYCAMNSISGVYEEGSLFPFDTLRVSSTPAPVTASVVPQLPSPPGTLFTFNQAGVYLISIVLYGDVLGVTGFINVQPIFNGLQIGISNNSVPDSQPIVFQFLQTAAASDTFAVNLDIGMFPIFGGGSCTITFVKLS